MTNTALSTSAITLGYAQITSSFATTTVGSMVDVTSLATTVTVPAGGRRIEIAAYATDLSATSTNPILNFAIREGATTLNFSTHVQAAANYSNFAYVIYSVVPSAGSHTYKMSIQQNIAGTLTLAAGATYPASILVKLI